MIMRALLIGAALALAAGCSPHGSASAGHESASVSGCQAIVADHWRPASGVDFAVEAQTFGPNCEKAVATLVIRNTQGGVVWTESYPTQNVMVLAPAHDAAAMQAALRQWITESNHTITTSSAFPEWPQGASGPQNGEFPFYPSDQFDRDNYEALRRTNTPVYCYVQGAESQACLALMNGELVNVGVQTFPG